MSLSIRPAAQEDLERIILFNQAMARETEGRELDRRTLSKGVERLLKQPARGLYFVAEQDGEIVGQLMITTEWSDWRNGEIWWIQSVYVSKRLRRAGVYRHLARKQRVIGLRLYVERDNQPAQATYDALGMEESSYRVFEEFWA